jgi:hypothetical protein
MAKLPELSNPTRDAIFRSYENDSRDGFRSHLGASLIGRECERDIWYSFRWVMRSNFSGRMVRLFETGQLAESRFIQDLRRTGATVIEVDPETGRQFTVTAHGGHFGGSLDGVGYDLLEAPHTWHVLEFKTHSDKSFNDLLNKRVFGSKEQHYAQMQIYMRLIKLTRTLYMAVNKNNDDLYLERIELDIQYADRLLAKAKRIIDSPNPLPKISNDADWYQCRMCSHASICHESAAIEVNCRTCMYSTPIEGAWHCAKHDSTISDREQRLGCDFHLYIPSLVPAEQIDAGDGWVEYQLSNGQLWRDTGSNKSVELAK